MPSWTQEAEQAVLSFFRHVAQERNQLAADLTLSSPVRERHAVARDLAQAVVDAIDPPEAPAEEPAPAEGGGTPPPAAE